MTKSVPERIEPMHIQAQATLNVRPELFDRVQIRRIRRKEYDSDTKPKTNSIQIDKGVVKYVNANLKMQEYSGGVMSEN